MTDQTPELHILYLTPAELAWLAELVNHPNVQVPVKLAAVPASVYAKITAAQPAV